MRLHITHNGNKKEIVEVPEENHSIEILHGNKNNHLLYSDNKVFDIQVVSYDDKNIKVLVNGKPADIEIESDLDILLAKMGIAKKSRKGAKELKAPMPGLVKKILVRPGEEVKKNTPLLILEAMKMENIIKAAGDGKVKEILVNEGEAVEKNTLLIRFDV